MTSPLPLTGYSYSLKPYGQINELIKIEPVKMINLLLQNNINFLLLKKMMSHGYSGSIMLIIKIKPLFDK